MYFTLYTVTERVNFAREEGLDDHHHDGQNLKPIDAHDIFHSQFALSLDQYVDNNNYFKLNKVELKNDRLMIWRPTLLYRFLDYEQSPRWYGTSNIFHDLSSFDQGKTYEVVNG